MNTQNDNERLVTRVTSEKDMAKGGHLVARVTMEFKIARGRFSVCLV